VRQNLPRETKVPSFAPLEADIERYGLADYLAELDDQGLCIIPLSRLQVGDDFVARATAALLGVAEKRTGARFDVNGSWSQPLDRKSERLATLMLTHLLHEDPVFEEIYVNPIRKTVMRHLLGDVHRMSTSNGWIKARTPDEHQGELTTGMHVDTTAPTPWPLRAPHVSNMNWILTDYDKENGAFAYVPESHLRGTPPTFPEAMNRAVPVEAPAGSLFFFHGATWHGAFRKQTEGLRMSIHGLCCQPHYIPQQDYRGHVDPAVFSRSRDPEYLRTLVREDDPWLKVSP